jgi:peptide/nickel transport system substrate-binding protein
VAAAKKLLAEAGYPNGFEVVFDCPNDRYVNDEGICQAVAQMLSRIDIKVKLNAMPKAKYFQKAGPTDKYDSSFNLLGWTPGSLDSWNVVENIIAAAMPTARCHFQLRRLLQSRDDGANKLILVEPDTKKATTDRRRLRLAHDESAHPAASAIADLGCVEKVKIVQRADNQILFYWATME